MAAGNGEKVVIKKAVATGSRERGTGGVQKVKITRHQQ